MTTKRTVTYNISEKVLNQLRKLSYTSRKNKSELVEEALKLLFVTPGGQK